MAKILGQQSNGQKTFKHFLPLEKRNYTNKHFNFKRVILVSDHLFSIWENGFYPIQSLSSDFHHPGMKSIKQDIMIDGVKSSK